MTSSFPLFDGILHVFVFFTKSGEVLWVGDDDAAKNPESIQEAFARRKKSGLSDAELNKRHRRVSLVANSI